MCVFSRPLARRVVLALAALFWSQIVINIMTAIFDVSFENNKTNAAVNTTIPLCLFYLGMRRWGLAVGGQAAGRRQAAGGGQGRSRIAASTTTVSTKWRAGCG